jgi:ElaB/YqjD/DUF883 family membrane-anchored ribosome-binding protein
LPLEQNPVKGVWLAWCAHGAAQKSMEIDMNAITEAKVGGAVRSAANEVNNIGNSVASLRDDVKDVVSTVAQDAKHKVDAMGRELRDTANTTLMRVQEQVREKPAATLGIAAGVGLILGMLLANRR